MYLPKISIITPSFNQGEYIEQTILSIIEQDYPNYELIIIDGGSKDSTLNVISKYESKIAYWVSEPDNGQAHAINKGIAMATGDVFNWINSDDYLEPGALHIIGEFFSKHPEKKSLCGFTHCFFEEDKKTSHTYRMGVEATTTDTITHFAMNQPGTFYRMSVIKQLNGVNDSLRYVFDNELWFRYLSKYGADSVGVTDKLFAHFRLHLSSKSVHEGFELFWYEQNDIWVHLAEQLSFSKGLLECLKELPQANKYNSEFWDVKELDRGVLMSFWYEKFINTIFLKGYHQEAKQAMKLLIRSGKFKISRLYFSLLFKLFVVPSAIQKK
ncbi:glycosyltransferase family 2 protein [Pontibacter pamirensis]|uniref:glycosyltransferase family 2 protein n=1 Tax=Pontibacter pamirensis TaxID=2562824 RepID=UPI00192E49D7|nr:glycosyltransferase family 2 protein [Pontibacter pamirensis]